MRESFGGSMLFYIVLFFLTIFIFFIASVIRYARVYKIKNSVINYIERNEGITNRDGIDEQLKSMSYSGKYRICRNISNDYDGGYYSLILYASFELPIVGNMVGIDVAIKGDTTTITTGTSIKGEGNLFTDKEKIQCFECRVNGSCVGY